MTGVAGEGSDVPTACGETLAVVRKKALLRLLCRREAERMNLRPAEGHLQAEAERFRETFGLVEDRDFAGWLDAVGLSEADFALAMQDVAVLRLVEDAHAVPIDDLVASQVALGMARHRLPSTD